MFPEPDQPSDPSAELNALRVEIDRLDAAMHGLLIKRSAIIDELIGIKARQGGGSAFRPGREAEMMRRIAERHRGRLPLDTVESIWRVIISTFTYVQSNYAVHADMAGGDAAMRDCARFHFGFTVPLHSHFGSDGVVAAVATAEGDLGLLRIEGHASRGSWWRGLVAPEAPKIIARLPFVERPDHPAAIPVFVVARPIAAAASPDVGIHAATIPHWHDPLLEAVASVDGEIIGQAVEADGLGLLIAAPGGVGAERLTAVIERVAGTARVAKVGSHAARFEMSGQPAG